MLPSRCARHALDALPRAPPLVVGFDLPCIDPVEDLSIGGPWIASELDAISVNPEHGAWATMVEVISRVSRSFDAPLCIPLSEGPKCPNAVWSREDCHMKFPR